MTQKRIARAMSEETVQAMQADRDAGVLLREIAKKYGVSIGSVNNHTSPAPREYDDARKADWPEWVMWDALHRKYGKKS